MDQETDLASRVENNEQILSTEVDTSGVFALWLE